MFTLGTKARARIYHDEEGDLLITYRVLTPSSSSVYGSALVARRQPINLRAKEVEYKKEKKKRGQEKEPRIKGE